MTRTLKDLSKYVEAEAARNGREAQEELRSFRAYYRLAQQLMDRRKEQGLTQQELAKRSGIRQSEISKIEGGSANPTVHTLNAIAGALGSEISLVEARRGRGHRKTVVSGGSRGRVSTATQRAQATK